MNEYFSTNAKNIYNKIYNGIEKKAITSIIESAKDWFEEDEEMETYKLVTSICGNSLQGLISIESPLGKAIRGHKVGDRVKVVMDNGYEYYVVIKRIETSPDEENTIRKY